jgi:para-aminobenzoate synthetase/4-amino-4-deoxychorismate lyase
MDSSITAVLFDANQGKWLRFMEPVAVHAASDLESVARVLRAAPAAVSRRHYVVGFVAYEAAPAFDPALVVKPVSDFPLAWFAVYAKAQIMDFPGVASVSLGTLDWRPSITEEEYHAALRRIKGYIHDGETYQVNYSLRLHASFHEDPWSLFVHMTHAQGHGYGAFIDTGDWCICSASHELFFSHEKNMLTTMPMKGTVPRALNTAGDRERAGWLQHSPKNRAENLMIVDMVRNDLGRIAVAGSVQTASLFDVERYPTLWQMTSTVRAITRADIDGVFRALFPPASVTGAPKARTMDIIAELETKPRKIYTGSIGFIRPDHSAQFNVAIRTVLIDKKNRLAEYGVGGGIVWDSETRSELEECYTKARVLTYVPEEFDLLETLLWTPEDGYTLLPLHLDRLRDSAEYFSRPLDLDLIQRRLAELAAELPRRPHRIRLRVAGNGGILTEARLLDAPPKKFRLHLAGRAVDPDQDLFLHHKTTRRQTYEKLLAEFPDYDDVLLFNKNHEVTESCIANVVIELNGELVTPPLACGLLPGTYRRHLLEQGKIKERTVTLADIENRSSVFLINSVRGMWEAALTLTEAPATL